MLDLSTTLSLTKCIGDVGRRYPAMRRPRPTPRAATFRAECCPPIFPRPRFARDSESSFCTPSMRPRLQELVHMIAELAVAVEQNVPIRAGQRLSQLLHDPFAGRM